MALSSRQLNRATLDRQLLLERSKVSVPEAVKRVVAIQAQEPASPYLALWNRIDGFDPIELDEAFATRVVVKASLLRITLHTVHSDDYTVFHESMLPALRGSRLADNRFLLTGMTVDEADALVPKLLEYARTPRTKVEIEAMFGDELGERPHSRLWWALRTYAPLIHFPGARPGLWSGSSFPGRSDGSGAIEPRSGFGAPHQSLSGRFWACHPT